MCSDDGALNCASLTMLIIEVSQFEQVLLARRSRADEVSHERPVISTPRALVQHLPAQIFHIASVRVTDIDDEESARAQMGAHGCQSLLLGLARGDMGEGTQSDKSHTELLLQVHAREILLDQCAALCHTGLLEPLLSQEKHGLGRIDARQFEPLLRKWKEDAPTATGQFQDFATTQFSEVAIHIQIFAEVGMLNIVKGRYYIVIVHKNVLSILNVISISDLPGASHLMQLEMDIIRLAAACDRHGDRCRVRITVISRQGNILVGGHRPFSSISGLG